MSYLKTLPPPGAWNSVPNNQPQMVDSLNPAPKGKGSHGSGRPYLFKYLTTASVRE